MSSKVTCYIIILVALSGFISGGCEKRNSGIETPVEKIPLFAINNFYMFHMQQTQVGCSAYITSNGVYEVLEKGMCWSKFIRPTVFNNKTIDGSGVGSFKTLITGLSANSTYYARPYAISNRDTIYGEEKSFTTLIEEDMNGVFTDSRDSNEYRWVRIGTQIWMAENLAYLPSVSPPNEGSVSSPFYYVYNYYGTDVFAAKDTYYYALYSTYYNWEAALQGEPGSGKDPSGTRGVCPTGWHLPSNAEWEKLNDYVKNDGYLGQVGLVLKSKSGWFIDSGNGTDEYGFSALPNGGRADEMGGKFGSGGLNSHWWSCTDDATPNGWMWDITHDDLWSMSFIHYDESDKSFAFGVRCVGDKTAN